MSGINFESVLGHWFDRFVQLKHTTGVAYNGPARLLHRFDCYLAQHAESAANVDAQLLGAYIASTAHLAPRSRSNIVSVIWPAMEYAIRHGAPCPPIPLRPTFPQAPSCLPVILTDTQIRRLLSAARGLPPRPWLAPHTYATLFGLLIATGIRIGEARRLQIRDIDPVQCTLLIREGKFRKSRLLPLHDSTVSALNDYISRRQKAGMPCGSEAPLFLSQRGNPLAYKSIWDTFRQLCESTGICAEVGQPPRLHDLRHGFAVRSVIAWYRAGIDVNTRLRALSTYLGHVNVEKTLVYLRPHEALLTEAAHRFEAACAPAFTISKEVSKL
jgi:integrase